MKYVYLEKPEYNSETETLSPDYKIDDGVFIAGWRIENKPEDGGYAPIEEQEPIPSTEPSKLDCLEAQILYTALMTDTLLGV